MLTTTIANVPLNGLSSIQDYFPGKTAKSTATLLELVKKNNLEHDIFFNERGFHNHLDHHIYAAYSLGADSSRLHTIYNFHASYQKPRKTLHSNTITKYNFNENLSNRSYWADYQLFFQKELSQFNFKHILNELFSQDEMLYRLEGGVIHPLIHIGYGLEFNDPITLSEGLAMCAVSPPLKSLIEPLLHSVKTSPTKQHPLKSPKDLWKEILEDDRFYNLTKLEDDDGDRTEEFFARQGEKVLHEYLSQFHVEPTEADIKEKYSQLFELIVIAYAALTPPDRTPKFDFSIMHCLTSVYFLPLYFKYLSYEKSALLLRIHFAIVSVYWITAGRPKFHLENLLNYTPLLPPHKDNPWLTIIEAALSTEDEHVCKALRSLIWAAGNLGENRGLWLKAAQATVDHVQGVTGSPATRSWSFLKLGYEEGWKQEKPKTHEDYAMMN